MAAERTTVRQVELALAGRNGVLAAAACFLIAAYYGATAIALLAAACLLLAGLGWASAWLSTWGVQYARSLGAYRAFPGETIRARVRVANPKPLPAPWLEVAEDLPAALQPEKGPPRRVLHLPWRSVAAWDYTLGCQRRGCYTWGPAQLRGGDPFGVAGRAVASGGADEIIVYPRLLPVGRIGLPARAIFGRQRPPRSLFEDASRMAGLRDYLPGDALNRVHWKATARHGALKMKVYEPTTTPQALLVLALDDLAAGEAVDEELGEHAISVAASLAHEGAGLGWSVGLIANGRPPVVLGPSGGREQVPALLEALARLTLACDVALPKLLAAQRAAIPAGSTVVFVAAALSPALARSADELALAGHALAFVFVGREAEATGPTVGRWPAFQMPLRAG